jgi:hypothetical protein
MIGSFFQAGPDDLDDATMTFQITGNVALTPTSTSITHHFGRLRLPMSRFQFPAPHQHTAPRRSNMNLVHFQVR